MFRHPFLKISGIKELCLKISSLGGLTSQTSDNWKFFFCHLTIVIRMKTKRDLCTTLKRKGSFSTQLL
ncbi:hypothetical protein CEE45_10820 [Candidatus Heimdallarchaeota archaeon B3_Heim]|nr:MAG: hypothetical protein CEE45_10820 [Candidatus Heimdallarchaeota archaeon B3_Heim]